MRIDYFGLVSSQLDPKRSGSVQVRTPLAENVFQIKKKKKKKKQKALNLSYNAVWLAVDRLIRWQGAVSCSDLTCFHNHSIFRYSQPQRRTDISCTVSLWYGFSLLCFQGGANSGHILHRLEGVLGDDVNLPSSHFTAS